MKINNQKTLIIVSMVIYVGVLLLYNLGNSVMPLFLKNTEFGTAIFGYLMGCMFLGQFLISPFWGALSDKYGRIVLAISPCGYGVGQLLYVLSTHSFLLLILSRVVAGIFSVLFLSQFVAYISDVAPEKIRQRTLSLAAIMVPLGTGFAYLIGGFIKSPAFTTILGFMRRLFAFLGEEMSSHLTQVATFPFVMQFIIGFFVSIFLYFFIKHNNQYQILNVEKGAVERNPVKRLVHQFRIFLSYKQTIVFSVIAISFFNSAGYVVTQSIQYYLQDALGLDAQAIGSVVFRYNIASVVLSLCLQGVFLRKYSTWKNLLIANAVVVFFVVLLMFANVWQLIILMSIIMLMNTLLVSIIQGTLVDYDVKQRGVLLGMNQSAISLASILGNFIMSPLYGYAPAVFNYRLPFLMMSSVLAVATLIILFPLRKQMHP